MGAPPSSSFTSRRPNASNLPSFELPPPPLVGFAHKYQNYPNLNPIHPSASSLTSIGNLLTPPSNNSADSLSPISSGVTSSSSQAPPFTPTGSGMWAPPPNPGNAPFGFQGGPATQHSFGRSIFSPSMNSIIRGTSSPTVSEGLPPPPYELPQYSTVSAPMSAPALPASSQHQQMIGNALMGGQAPGSTSVTQSSPVSAQEAFARPPPTPTYYNNSQPSSSAPPQGSFSYSTGPSPVQQSPISTGSMKMSPVNGHGPVPQLQSQQHAYNGRPYTYPLPGPVLSNVNNPGGQLQMIGGLPHGMIPGGFNSGHAASMQHLYGHPPQQSPQNDRPFRCDQCPQSFNRNHDLKRHKRIHLAVKPFPCGHCDKSFSRKDALKVREIPFN